MNLVITLRARNGGGGGWLEELLEGGLGLGWMGVGGGGLGVGGGGGRGAPTPTHRRRRRPTPSLLLRQFQAAPDQDLKSILLLTNLLICMS